MCFERSMSQAVSLPTTTVASLLGPISRPKDRVSGVRPFAALDGRMGHAKPWLHIRPKRVPGKNAEC